MPYRAPLPDYEFLFRPRDRFRPGRRDRAVRRGRAEDMVAAILTEAGKMCEEVMAPLQRAGDLHPARLENGVVRTSPGFAEGFRAIAEGGWIGISADPGIRRHGPADDPDRGGQRDDERARACRCNWRR